MRIGSLFSGIGGLELGLEAAFPSAQTVWQVEREPFCRTVLARHWASADRSVTDVREAGTDTLSPVDLICGGFPCQDLSPAGSRRGLSGARSGLAWEFLRVVGEMAPPLVVVENTGHGWRGWVPQLRSALWAGGYASVPIQLSAREVGAPHRRARVFLVAWRRASPDANGQPLRHAEQRRPSGRAGLVPDGGEPEPGHDGGAWAAAWPAPHANGEGLALGQGERRDAREELAPPLGGRWGPPPPAIRRVDDGPRPGMDRPRLTALGNAVVPQCAEAVGLWIAQSGLWPAQENDRAE